MYELIFLHYGQQINTIMPERIVLQVTNSKLQTFFMGHENHPILYQN